MNRPPTEMEKRVLDAILLAVSAPPPPSDDEPFIDWDAVSRAAIRAMREPTKEMIAEGNDKIEYDLDHGYPSTGPSVEILPTSARDAWRAMIDAASPP